MQPRSKQGPSWANDANQLQPSMVDVPGPSKLKSKKQSAKEQPPPPETDTEERQEGVSDLEWMQQRMSKKIDDKAFEQSDEEAEEELEKEV